MSGVEMVSGRVRKMTRIEGKSGRQKNKEKRVRREEEQEKNRMVR